MGGFTMWTRRDFLKNIGLAGALVGTGLAAKKAVARDNKLQKITFLHTNDLHSRIEPFPKNHPKYSGLGALLELMLW